MINFWQKLNKPIYALAPMAGITDSAFRQIAKSFGADIVYSEMASTAALFYNSPETLDLLSFDKAERPYVVQLFGSDPAHFAFAARVITEKIDPDGIDINFGCPVPKVARQGAGCALMNDPVLSRKVIQSVIDNTGLPVSIKIRAKSKERTALEFLDAMDGLDIKTVMIHGRTLSQGFGGQVDFDLIRKARDHFGGIILANGGAIDEKSISELLEKTNADGVGIARGALGNPWIFKIVESRKSKVESYLKKFNSKDIFEIALRHARLAERLKGKRGILEMRKHLCWYVSGLPDAKRIRAELLKTDSIGSISAVFDNYSNK